MNVPAPQGKPILRVEMDGVRALVPFLSWDTEGGDQTKMNLLRAPVEIFVKTAKTRRAGKDLPTQCEVQLDGATRYRLALGPEAELLWEIKPKGGNLSISFLGHGRAAKAIEGVEMVFPFDVRVASTTVLASEWTEEGHLQLPAIISAPDFGQLHLACAKHPNLTARLEGSRAQHTVDLVLELPAPRNHQIYTLEFRPVVLSVPRGLKDRTLWPAARRGWFNVFQPSAQWGDPGNAFSAPPGILANNVVSDPVSCLIGLYGDQAFLMPELAPEVSAAAMIRRTVDWWLDHRTRANGEVVAYWNYGDMLDANASPLIAAWDYVEATKDRSWLADRIERLEFIAGYLAKRDVDHDGLVESTHSGNYGTLFDPARAGSAYDTINAGHKDAYSNALTYRAWRCLADLERHLDRQEQQKRYTELANGLKAVFAKTFFDKTTGWLAWWKSEDGELHNLASPMINGIAIEYGLVELGQARSILTRLWKKIEAVGFKRFDLGVPITLVPVRRGDYLQPKAKGGKTSDIPGAPGKEDGTDTFGQYLNGGCLVSDAVHFITALYIAGEDKKADRILHAMLERQVHGIFPNGGAFQNGVVDQYPRGAEFFDWNGNTCGYEGHLTYSFSFLQAVMLREPAFRTRLFRPMERY